MQIIERKLLDHYLLKYGTIDSYNEHNEKIDSYFDHTNKSFIEKELERYLHNVKKVGVYSLSYNKSQELLWGLYADGMKGFGIEYNKHELLKINHNTSFDVDYYKKEEFHSRAQAITSDLIGMLANPNAILNQISSLLNLNTLWGKKVRAWEYEEEFRIIFDSYGKVKYTPSCIKAIYLGCKMDQDIINLLINSAPKHVKFYHSMPAIDPNTGMIYFHEAERGKFSFNVNSFPQLTI